MQGTVGRIRTSTRQASSVESDAPGLPQVYAPSPCPNLAPLASQLGAPARPSTLEMTSKSPANHH